MLQRMVEAKAICRRTCSSRPRCSCASTPATRSRPAGSSARPSTARGASPSFRPAPATASEIGMPVRSADGLVGRIIDVGALASRVLLVSDRPASSRRGCCETAFRSLPRGAATGRSTSARSKSAAIRSSAATSSSPRAPAGFTRRWCPIARVVKLDDDGAVALPLADPATTSFAIVEPPFEPAAIAAEKRRPQPTRPDGPRRAWSAARRDRPGPDALCRCLPAATVVAASLLSALPIVSTSGWYPDFGYPRADQLAAASRRPVAGLVGRSAGLRQRPVHRISDRLFNSFVECDHAGARPDRPPHDVARLLDRMGACGGADRD